MRKVIVSCGPLLFALACAHKATLPPVATTPAAQEARSVASAAPSPAVPKAAAAETQAQGFSCPMHRDVRATAPGTCSKCGMALEADAKAPVPATK